MLLIATPPRDRSPFGTQEGLVPAPGTLCYIVQRNYDTTRTIHPDDLLCPDKKWLVGVSLGFVTGPTGYVSQEILLANKMDDSSNRILSVEPGSIMVLPESVFLDWKRNLPSPKIGGLIKQTIRPHFQDFEDMHMYLRLIKEMWAFRDKHIRIYQPSSRKKLPDVPEAEKSFFFFLLGKYLKTENQITEAIRNYRRALQIAELQDRK